MRIGKCKGAGFSLVELSIVLVILGLLTGGILAGQSLIRAAELRALPTELGKMQTAVYSFRDKYFGLPGDITNATSIWGNAATGATGGQCTNSSVDAGTGTQTCNGNGDGLINEASGTPVTGIESRRLWQHLANAGLIEGSFTGTQGGAGAMQPGVNMPRSKLGNNTTYRIVGSGASYFGVTSSGNILRAGGPTNTFGNDNAILKAEEAWNIDTKMDDGRADQGRLYGNCGYPYYVAASNACDYCTTGHWGVAGASEYRLTDTNTSCYMQMKLN